MNHEIATMWTYWKDKKGIEAALEDYFPERLAESAELQQALAMIKNGTRAINAIFAEMEETEDGG